MAHILASSIGRRHGISTMGRALCGVWLLAALVVLITCVPSEGQQIDFSGISTTSGALASAAPNAPASLAAQSEQQMKLAVTGCGPTKGPGRQLITFVEERRNLWYRATMKGIRGTTSPHAFIIGGLLPTWNLAAMMGSEGGTAPGNVMTAIAWTLPNEQIGASPYPPPRVRLTWGPNLTATCQTP
jgi:hypothetical protein